MSSIHIINKNTDNKKGTGLPFYEKIDYIFSRSNNEYGGAQGLWNTPPGKIPTFQLWLDRPTLSSLIYRSMDANGNFIPTNDIVYIPSIHLSITPVLTNGIQEYIVTSKEDVPLSPVPPSGKWIIELGVTSGEDEKLYYSEEFTTKDCC